ncbi:glucan 1,4-alpha-glucosidase, partial [Halonotius sp. GCM10025705]
MQLRDALDDYKRSSGDSTLFAGERRTLSGRFSGGDGRLVHIDEGVIRDFGYPLSGLTGLERSRFGLSLGDEKFWFDEDATSTQTYYEDTGLVKTVHETPIGEVTELDLTIGNAHLTHFETVAEHAEIIAYVSLAPDGRHSRLGQLHHEDVIEVYHETEHDFLGSATGFAGIRGQIPASFDDLISEEPTEYPRPPHDGRYAEDRLSGDLVCWLPLDHGSTTLITLLTDWEETDRADALAQMETFRTEYTDRAAFEEAAAATAPLDDTDDLPLDESISADVRVLSLLTGTTGLRMAGPDFDPYYRHSGGYGYTWFRDDAEISLFVLESDQH